MFHWTAAGHYVVLTDQEESDLVRSLGSSAEERVGYWAVLADRKRIEKRIGAYLERKAVEEPTEFARMYIHRCAHGPSAAPILRALLEGYARTVKRAVWGVPDTSFLSDIPSFEAWSQLNPVSITTLAPSRSRWFGSPQPASHIGFAGTALEQVTGSSTTFYVVTSHQQIAFTEQGVSVFDRALIADRLPSCLCDASATHPRM